MALSGIRATTGLVVAQPPRQRASRVKVEVEQACHRVSPMRRFTRHSNAFGKKLDNRAHMVAFYALWYNFVRVHKTPRTSPAMAAGIETRLWSMKDVVRLIERREDFRSGSLLIGAD